MKKVLKFIILPLALTCCSMTSSNAPSFEFLALSIVDETATTLKLSAYIDIKVSGGKWCDWIFFWLDETGNRHNSGSTGYFGLSKEKRTLTGCSAISLSDLKSHSPVKLGCEVTITGDVARQITMPYCTKTIDDFEISESTNNKELATGYHKESTFEDPSKNYCYENAITFLNYEDLRVNDIYYDLDISYLRFKFRDGMDNTMKGNFRFAFYDRYDLFPEFEIGESMYRYIPLTVHKDKDECYFTFTPTMYYDPVTHDCGLSQKEGYIATNHLMLPFKGASELKFLPCYIELTINSHTTFNVKGKFMMTYLKKYYGDCTDSEFCEELHQDDETNIREKIIEVTI